MTRLVVDVMESSDYISRRICSSYPVCGRWTLDGRFTVICDMSPTRGEVDDYVSTKMAGARFNI